VSRFHVLVLLASLMVIPPRCEPQHQQRFEDWHRRGLKQNPAGLTVKLHTRDNTDRYAASERVNLQLSITSLSDTLYEVETAGMSGDEVVLQGSNTDKPRISVDKYGIACCSSAVKPLSKNPVNVATRLYLHLRPGEYSLFVKTKRVSRGGAKPGHYADALLVTSDVLHLTITPDHN